MEEVLINQDKAGREIMGGKDRMRMINRKHKIRGQKCVTADLNGLSLPFERQRLSVWIFLKLHLCATQKRLTQSDSEGSKIKAWENR